MDDLNDPHDLARFVDAQRGSYPAALAELRAGAKRSHWMWFIFPQIAGLGQSSTSRFYAIASLDEARAYLAHPTLGARLVEATTALLDHREKSAEAILGGIDAVKLRSSLTLFLQAGGDGVLGETLEAFFGGEKDPATLRLAKK